MSPATPPPPSPQSSVLDQVARILSILSDHGFAVAVLVTLEALRSRRSIMDVAARLAVVGVPIIIVNTVAKRLVGRARPETAHDTPALVRRPSSSSFPSGHTLASATAAIALPLSSGGQGAALTGAAIVGWSRVRLGAHHTSDVIGGLLIGAGLGFALRPVVRAVDRECNRHRAR